MLKPEKKYYTVEEYLEMEEVAEYKSEYFNGEIFAMAGGSVEHDIISGNIYAALNQEMAAKPCITFTSNMRVLVKENGLYTYPDASVVCGDIEFQEGRRDVITNPILIIEVLSKSTRKYDRTAKFALYRDIKTFQEYVLIYQDKVGIECFWKLDDGSWELQLYDNIEDTLKLAVVVTI